MIIPTTASASAAMVKRIGAADRRNGVIAPDVAVGGGSGVTGVETVAGTDAGTGDAGTGKSGAATDFSAFLRCRYSRARSAAVLVAFLGLG
jgi:hypothetical protein